MPRNYGPLNETLPFAPLIEPSPWSHEETVIELLDAVRAHATAHGSEPCGPWHEAEKTDESEFEAEEVNCAR